jgi:hypothetical protein
MYAYFSNYSSIAIILPSSEMPGDIYITPHYGYVARRNLCFSGFQARSSTTNFPDSLNTHAISVGGELGAALAEIASVSVQAQGRASQVASISFSEARIDGYSRIEVENATSSNSACVAEIQRILQSSGYSYYERVPWMLQDVVYAKMNTRIDFSQAISSESRVEIEERVKSAVQVDEFAVSGAIDSQGVVTLSTDRTYPVAYRPAFLSISDLDRIRELESQGLFDLLQQWLGLQDAPEITLQEIREKFPEALLRPRDIYDQMVLAPYTQLDIETQEHRDYLQNRALILSASWELFPDN